MVYDLLVIGSGPSGLTAATYASRDNLSTLVIGGGKWGGQLMLTSEVENFPGFPEGIMGPELMAAMKKQAERFGAEIKLTNATAVNFKATPFTVTTDEGEGTVYSAKSILIATGADTVWLGVPNEEKLIGKGVSSCAPCDAFFFKGKKVIVVGGGDAAMEEALTLSKFASTVTIVHRREACRASKIMLERVQALPNVSFQYNTVVTEIIGENKVTGVVFKDTLTSAESNFDCDGVFVAIGHSPNTKIFEGQLKLDVKGYILREGEVEHSVDQNEHTHSHYQMMTSVAGVFVAGDVHDHHFRQAVTAAGFGCQAALEVIRYLQEK